MKLTKTLLKKYDVSATKNIVKELEYDTAEGVIVELQQIALEHNVTLKDILIYPQWGGNGLEAHLVAKKTDAELEHDVNVAKESEDRRTQERLNHFMKLKKEFEPIVVSQGDFDSLKQKVGKDTEPSACAVKAAKNYKRKKSENSL